MRHRRGHHLPWALALFVPLLAVAVLGALELNRQGARATDAVQQQAATFLRGARLHFEEQVRTRVDAALLRTQLRSTNLVGEALAAIEHGDRVLDLFCLDGKAQLIHPRLAMPRETALPFLMAPVSDELRLAEHVARLGDRPALLRARAILQRYLQRPRQAQPNERAHAAFRLGGVLRQLGETAAAEEAYLEARVAAVDTEAGPIGIELLTRLAVAELAPRRDGLIELAREISENTWFAVPDELASAVFARAVAAVPLGDAEASADQTIATLRALETVRRSSRRLAAEFERFAAPALQRVLSEAPSGTVLRSIGAGAECALLALRATTSDEQAAAGRNARWLGLRIDLPGLVNDVMDAFLTPGGEGYRLVVLDPDGTPILDGGNPDANLAGSLIAPEARALAGLVLRAVPVDPVADLRDERAAVRNRILILTALLALALAGGFLLVRSVTREAELSTLKMEFVSRMSHELKTPLSLIKMYGETIALRRAKDTDQAAHFGEIVAREADRLTSQIERILAFSQQQSGTLQYAPQNVDLVDVVADVVEEYRDHVERNGCTLSASIDESARAGLLASVDPHALHLALVSLIENSVKYTPKTQVDKGIVVTVSRAGDQGVIAVTDRGIGIPAAERVRVFEAFYRASNAGEVRGAGLGLCQVQHFVCAHRGNVEVLPNPIGGTILSTLLPLLPQNQLRPPTR